jgi:hypothetical protein
MEEVDGNAAQYGGTQFDQVVELSVFILPSLRSTLIYPLKPFSCN